MDWKKIHEHMKKYSMVIAILYSTFIVLVMWRFDGFRWEGADDFTISQLLMGASGEKTPYVLTCSLFLGKIIIFLQNLFPFVNWFTYMEIFSVWIFWVIYENYILKRIDENKLFIALLMPIIFEPLFLLNLQYTRTAFILPYAGLLLSYDVIVGDEISNNESCDKQSTSAHKENEFNTKKIYKFKKIMLILFSMILFVLGTFFRFLCFYACIAYIGVLSVVYIRKNKRVGRTAWFYGITIVVLVLSIGFYRENNRIYKVWAQGNDYSNYNKKRSEVTDYMPVEYLEEFGEGEFKVSYNDWYMMRRLVINDRVFSYEYFENVLDTFKEKEKINKENILYNLKQIVLCRSGRNAGYPTLFITFVFISVVCLLMAREKWQRAGIWFNIVLTITLIIYFIAGNRFPSWVADSIYLLASCTEVIFVCSLDCQLIDKYQKMVISKVFVVRIIWILSFIMNIISTGALLERNYCCDDDLIKIFEYIEMKEDVFLLDNITDSPYPYIDIYGATYGFCEGQWKNIFRVGNWDVEHPERNRQKNMYGIESVLYSLAEGKTKLISESNASSFNMYKTFFEEHYNLKVYFVCSKDFGNYGIYEMKVLTN